jgi:hypothetical protein
VIKMIVKEVRDEDFTSYKKPAMVIGFPTCNWKCGKELCQNSSLAKAPNIDIKVDTLVERYINNPITCAVICAGLEPMDSFEDLWRFIFHLRVKGCNDEVIIYTGYYKNEIPEEYLKRLSIVPNIIVKWGRFIPNQQSHFDRILGIGLASDNQFAERIS